MSVPNPAWVKACAGNNKFAQASVSSAAWERLCTCGCWIAAVYVVYKGTCGEPNSDVGYGFYSIRSAQAPGTSLILTLNTKYYTSGGGCSTTAFFNGTVPLVVGRDTGGQWVRLPGLALPNGQTLSVYLNSFQAQYKSTSGSGFNIPEYCGPSEYSIPIAFGSTGSDGVLPSLANLVTPGPIKWKNVIALSHADLGITTNNPLGSTDGVGTGPTINYAVCETTRTAYPGGHSAACPLDVFEDNTHRKRSFPRAVFTSPAGPLTVDSIFTVGPFQFYNPFTGNAMDGTHVFDDPQELDIDSVPGADIDVPNACNQIVVHSTVRNSFGNYTMQLQFLCQAGTRQFQIYGHHENGSFIPVSQYPILSTPIVVNVGNPAFVTMMGPGDDQVTVLYYRINQTILYQPGSTDVLAQILDAAGRFPCRFNLVTTATNSVTLELIDSGGNDWMGPTLNGTNPKSAVSGVAHFNDLSATALGNSYIVQVLSTSPSLALGGPSAFFRLGLTAGLKFEDASPLTLAHSTTYTIKVDIVDFNNVLISPPTQDPVTLSGGGSFTGFGTQTPTSGVASFTGSFPTPGTYTIQAATSGASYFGPGSPAPGQTDPAVTLTVIIT